MSGTALLRQLSVFVNLGADDTAKPHRESPENASAKREPRLGPRGGIATGTPRTSSKPSAHDGVPAAVDEVRSAFGFVEDHAVEASAGLFRQSSSESEDASSIANDICEESNEEELKADDVAIEPLPPERALELTHTTSVSVVLRQYSRSKLRRVGRPALYQVSWTPVSQGASWRAVYGPIAAHTLIGQIQV